MQDFIKISKYAGMRNDLAQAGGGNTSVKLDAQFMLVKSSGCQLADVGEENGYTKINYRLIADYFREQVGRPETRPLTEEAGNALLQAAQLAGGRASIETFLHAVTGKYTLHSHPTLVNILAAREGGKEEALALFPEAAWVPYEKPGAALAAAYYGIVSAVYGQPEVIFLENHGLVVSGGNAAQVIGRTEEILHKIAAHLQLPYDAYPAGTALWQAFSEIPALSDKIVYLSENRFLTGETLAALSGDGWNHAFCPDCVVYGGKRALFLPDDYKKCDIADFLSENQSLSLVCHRGRFYVVAESVRKAQEIENVMSFAAQVQLGNRGLGMNALTSGQQDALLNWDAEKYRRKL